MEEYVVLSLETHLFFARIMKEHGLFLEAGFLCVETEWQDRADWFRRQFENLLRDVVEISDGRVGKRILSSGELTTEYTLQAEERTRQLGGIPIDSRITEMEQSLGAGARMPDREMVRAIQRINERAIKLLDGFIDFKQDILENVANGTLFNANYPMLIKHILREAKLYRATVRMLMDNSRCSADNLRRTEEFWNRIMMEHALFIRGLLDPSEVKLIATADNFAGEYQELLMKARRQDGIALGLTEETLEETMKYRDFKAAGTKGILDNEIASIILPLLADHVLREANHYIRLLQMGNTAPCIPQVEL